MKDHNFTATRHDAPHYSLGFSICMGVLPTFGVKKGLASATDNDPGGRGSKAQEVQLQVTLTSW